MRARWLGAPLAVGLAIVLACATALLTMAPATAAAKPGFEVAERGLRLSLSPRASNGYAVQIATEGHRQVTLTARKGGVEASYTTSGRVDRRGITANFGELGRISVRFRGERRPFPGPLPPALEALLPDLELPRRKCHGRKPIREVGGFRGVVRFEGENGFTRIDARHAGGEVKRFYTRVCEHLPGSAGKRVEGRADPLGDFRVSLLYAADRSLQRKVSFEGVGLELGGPLEALLGKLFFVTAGVVERKDGMLITRKVVEVGDEGSVILSPPRKSPVTATITLPRPFRGTAKYRKEPGAASLWSGSLATRSPGAGLVPLTGTGFSAVLCRSFFSEILSNRCLRHSGVPLPGAVKAAPTIAARLRSDLSTR